MLLFWLLHFIVAILCNCRFYFSQEILQKASESLRSSLQGAQKGGRSEASVNGHAVHPVSNVTQRTGASASQKDKAKVKIRYLRSSAE
jgi:predicted Zn-dependent protease